MDSSVKLPYYATDVPLPLPTEAEIENALNISPEYEGKGVNLVEEENMLFVQEMTKVPVPRVYALYSNPQIGKNYIVMEHIARETLAKLWASLTGAEKESIVAKLHSYNTTRSYTSCHHQVTMSIDKQTLLDEIFWTQHTEAMINSSFITEAALNKAMVWKYTHDSRPHYKADFYCQCLPHIFCGHKLMFTHGDCQHKNIMIQSDPQWMTANNRTLEIVILDWEKSGWYSSYWEYCLAVCALCWDDDWGLWIEKMLDLFISEVSWLQILRLELWS
ncbi:hypothetical protein RJ035_006480 [Blastomyces gilchristii]